jgi:hypothetical protein
LPTRPARRCPKLRPVDGGRNDGGPGTAVDYALEAFERIDGLVNVVSTGRHGPTGVPSGWIYRVQLAWMAERGGRITNVYPVDGDPVPL